MFCFIIEHIGRQARVTGGKRKQVEDNEHGGKSYTLICQYVTEFSCEYLITFLSIFYRDTEEEAFK